MPEKRRIYLHPGFHKTGTSSIQHFLWVNREKFADTTMLFMLRHLQPVASVCHAFSKSLNPMRLATLPEALNEVFAPHINDPRDILISCEALSGHLPGWPGVVNYGAAPVLYNYLIAYLAATFGTDDIRMVLTTRDPDEWTFSAYRHHLKGHRLRLGRSEYATIHRKASDLDGLATEIAAAHCPLPVHTLRLEDSSEHELGPGGALLEAFGFPLELIAEMEPVGQGNIGPDGDLWHEFLRLNRSKMPEQKIRNEKDRLAKAAKLGGWRQAVSNDT